MSNNSLRQLAAVLSHNVISSNFEDESTLVIESMYNSVHVLTTLKMFKDLDYIATQEAVNDLKVRVSVPKERRQGYHVFTHLPSSTVYPNIDFNKPIEWQNIIDTLY